MFDASIRVLHVITRYLKRGGAEKNTLHTMRALHEEGIDTALLAGRGSRLEGLDREPFPAFQSDQLVNRIDPVRDVQAMIDIARFLRERSVEVVHTHQGKAGLIGRAAAQLVGVPVVIYGLHADHVSHPRLNVVTRPLYRVWEQVLGARTDYFVSVGEEIKRRYLNRGIGSPDQHTVIHSGMNLEPFQRARGEFSSDHIRRKRRDLGLSDPEVPVVGKVASLEPRKGFDDAIRIARKVVEAMAPDPVRFLFVGSGPERSNLEQAVAEADLAKEVKFTGYREDIAEVMACFDVFLFTSHMEGLPQVLVQAAATGLPIVTFRVEGVHEVIDHGESGWIIPDRDVSLAGRCVRNLLRDGSLRRRAGQRGQELADERWTVPFMKERVKAFYRKVFENRPLT